METKIDLGWLTTDGRQYPPPCPIIEKPRERHGQITNWPYCTLHRIWTDQCGCPAMGGYGLEFDERLNP